MKIALTVCLAIAPCWGLLAAGGNTKVKNMDAAILKRSLVDAGSAVRIQHAMARARRGEATVVGVIGGSITQGAKASRPEHRWGEQVGAWWRKRFPQSKVEFVNAGIGATGSNFGAHRIQKHLLVRQPDIVIAEYAVNDQDVFASAETIEGVVRQVLKAEKRPGMMLLFTMSRGGRNAQKQHVPVGRHYDLPMVSFRDAMWPEIEAGRLQWEDIIADEVHPNDPGHKLCADFVIEVLESIWKTLPEDGALTPIPAVPAPLHTDLFEFTAMYNAENLVPVKNQGWTRNDKIRFGGGWQAETPGSVLEFEVSGEQFILVFHRIRGDMGKVRVTVDDLPPQVFNAWFAATWGGYSANEAITRVPAGKHRLRIELLKEKAEESGGTKFEIQMLLAAGREK